MRAALALALLALVLPGLAMPAAAQDRQGRNTPGEWVVTHYKPFGLWDSVCDERTTGDVLEERCYLRYVDVFSPRPAFAAMFAFVTPPDGATEVSVGVERGTRFAEGGFRIERDGTTVWRVDDRACLVGRNCTWRGVDAQALLDTMAQGGALRFDFTDRHGQPQALTWDLSRFADALADYRAQAAARGLL